MGSEAKIPYFCLQPCLQHFPLPADCYNTSFVSCLYSSIPVETASIQLEILIVWVVNMLWSDYMWYIDRIVFFPVFVVWYLFSFCVWVCLPHEEHETHLGNRLWVEFENNSVHHSKRGQENIDGNIIDCGGVVQDDLFLPCLLPVTSSDCWRLVTTATYSQLDGAHASVASIAYYVRASLPVLSAARWCPRNDITGASQQLALCKSRGSTTAFCCCYLYGY